MGLISENKRLCEQGFKRCTRCLVVKPLEDFHNHFAAKAIGHKLARCKVCIYETRSDRVAVKKPRGQHKFTKVEHEAMYQRGEKYCPVCESVLPLGEFPNDISKFRSTAAHCRSCTKRKSRMRKYGLTLEQVLELETVEECPGCTRTFDEVEVKRYFDHCHKSGDFRRVLCRDCNLVLGIACDSPDTLRRLADLIT